MSRELGVGIIGCGNISVAYLDLSPLFKGYRIVAVADINIAAAEARAAEYDVRAQTVEDLLASEDIDLVINLTIPAAHLDVSRQILAAGKHVYSEKPFVLTLEGAQELGELAQEKGVRIGSAPDTFMGSSHQKARALIDDGAVGRVTSGLAMVFSNGMEDWHPNPDFFFKPGGGPILDLGPYYICNLVQMLGPVAQVTGMTGMATETRTIANGPRLGEEIPVETPTTIHAVLKFASGAIVTLLSSWDVHLERDASMELFGTEGTLDVPDPNFFGGDVKLTPREGDTEATTWDHPFGVPNFEVTKANYRGAGLADMALAIIEDRPHRCNEAFATHVIEVLTAILRAGEEGQVVAMQTTCERPETLGPDAARALLA